MIAARKGSKTKTITVYRKAIEENIVYERDGFRRPRNSHHLSLVYLDGIEEFKGVGRAEWNAAKRKKYTSKGHIYEYLTRLDPIAGDKINFDMLFRGL